LEEEEEEELEEVLPVEDLREGPFSVRHVWWKISDCP